MSSSTDQKRQDSSAAVGAGLPLPGQEMFGFEVKDVSIGFSLLSLAVYTLLRVFHDPLGLLCHLKEKQILSDWWGKSEYEKQKDATVSYRGIT